LHWRGRFGKLSRYEFRDVNLRRFAMKRLLTVVLVVQMGLFLAGCKKKAVEPAGEGPEKKATEDFAKPADTEKPQEPDISRGLVGWWKLDEVTGIRAADSSGHSRDGALKQSLSIDNGPVEGQIGKALNIGKADYVEITGYKGITGTEPRTVAAWVKTKSDNGHILDWGLDEGGQMFIFGFIPGRGRVGVTPKGGYFYMKDKVSDDKWHHVAAVVHKAELPNLHDDVTLYKDGEVAIIHDIGLLPLWPINTPSGMDVAIGKGFEGCIDDVRIYDRALSHDEIRLLFAAR